MREVWSSQHRKCFKSATDGPNKYSRKFPKHPAHLAPHCTTHCNIAASATAGRSLSSPQHPPFLTPLPTMAISGSAWAQQSSALILLFGWRWWWQLWWWELSYWKTHIETESQTRNTRHQKYPPLTSHGTWQSQERIRHQKNHQVKLNSAPAVVSGTLGKSK